jgi:hypothetical protein
VKRTLHALGTVLQLSGLGAALLPALALFNPAADLRSMLYLAGFGSGLFFLGWLLTKASD